MHETLRKVSQFMNTLPNTEPALKTWRKSNGQLMKYKVNPISLHAADSMYDDPTQHKLSVEGLPVDIAANQNLSSDDLATTQTTLPHGKMYMNPWGTVNSDLDLLENEPNSIKCLMQCRYLRPYNMKKL